MQWYFNKYLLACLISVACIFCEKGPSGEFLVMRHWHLCRWRAPTRRIQHVRAILRSTSGEGIQNHYVGEREYIALNVHTFYAKFPFSITRTSSQNLFIVCICDSYRNTIRFLCYNIDLPPPRVSCEDNALIFFWWENLLKK